jgi:DNA-binding NarL/FixJ family response regulator
VTSDSPPVGIVLAIRMPILRYAIRGRIELDDGVILLGNESVFADIVDSPESVVCDSVVLVVDEANLAAALGRRTTEKIVLVLSNDRDDLVFAALSSGVSGFVSHSSRLDDLVGLLKDVADGDLHLPQHLIGAVLRNMDIKVRNDQELDRRMASLTSREREVLHLLTKGADQAAVAAMMYISVHTVRTHLRRVLAKLGVHSQLRAISLSLAMTDGTPGQGVPSSQSSRPLA